MRHETVKAVKKAAREAKSRVEISTMTRIVSPAKSRKERKRNTREWLADLDS